MHLIQTPTEWEDDDWEETATIIINDDGSITVLDERGREE